LEFLPALFKSRFCAIGGGREQPCLSPDAGGASLVANPPEMAAKSLDLNKALIFFGYFFASRQKSNDVKINFK
jgi:hypothetical protein